MGRVHYDPVSCAKSHRLHYGSGMPVFRGEIRHTGYGIGGLLSGLARTVLPILTPIFKNVAKTAIRSGGQILSDVVSGKESFKSSAKKRIADAIDDHLSRPRPRRRRRGGTKQKDVFA